jgi:uncharacterized protein
VIIYQADKRQFLKDVDADDIERVVLNSYTLRTGKNVSRQEIRSWASSLAYMGKVLHDDGIPDECGVAIEYTIPQTAMRVDFLLTGKTEDDEKCVVIVELKQWEKVKKTSKDAVVSTRFANREQEVAHPSYQAWTYAALLKNFNEAVYAGGFDLRPCAYLHNYPEIGGDINDICYAEHVARAPLFLAGEKERQRLKDFIKRHVQKGDHGKTLYEMEGGRIRPSKSLAEGLLNMLRRNDEFLLIDDQKVVFELAMQRARQVGDKGKRVLIVEGGPGTGKSVVAVNLLARLTESGMNARYVTKNAAPRDVYQARLTGHYRKSVISNMFTGSGSFTSTPANEFDALVVDEAHRLNEKGGLYGNLGENQIKELINSARFTVFFIDEAQRVTLKDIGSKASISQWAEALGAKVEYASLQSQFRCNGSDGYLAWLDNTLQVRRTANEMLNVEEFDFRVVESPRELQTLIETRNKIRNRARVVAGYCWPWPSKKNSKAFDIVIPEHDFRAQWNLTTDGSLWIDAPNSVRQIGCIHTCQGLEVDYVGVIVGDDYIVRNGRAIARPEKRAKSDKSIKGLKKLDAERPAEAAAIADSIIKNTYRTLMTRGMKGCYIYCTDKETAEHFKSRIRGEHPPIVDQPLGVQAIVASIDTRPFRVVPTREVKPYQNAIPIIPLKMAAGAFSAGQFLDPNEELEWVAPGDLALGPNLFVAQVVGESMNRKIPNGAWCVFRMNPGGTRQGKVVLAQHRDIADPETGGSFTVKVYSSEKSGDLESTANNNVKIVLSPHSSDASFQPIVLKADSQATVIAELVTILA